MAAGLEPEMSAAFPLGKAENNYTIQVNVKVMDAYMLSTETFFTVRVSGNLLFYCVYHPCFRAKARLLGTQKAC